MNALAFTGLAIFWVVSNPETIQKRGSRKCSNHNRFTTGFTQSNARRPVSGRSESVVTQFSGCRVAPTIQKSASLDRMDQDSKLRPLTKSF
jgi:hypothetical protein